MILASDAILDTLGRQNRFVIAPWRAVVILRRATFTLPASQRRWSKLPREEADVSPRLRGMVSRRQLQVLTKTPRSFQVTTPFARQEVPSPAEVILELNPYAVISHASALSFHGLSTDFPQKITAMTPIDGKADILPFGTDLLDWEGLERPSGHAVMSVLGTRVDWQRTSMVAYFGFGLYPLGITTIRVTTPERTLVEGLRNPQLCGGIQNVLSAWSRAQWTLDVDAVIATVDRFNTGVLRQRVGYVMEELQLSHPALEVWRQSASRGGSSKLVAAEPYAPTYSDRWQLSLNGPMNLLASPS